MKNQKFSRPASKIVALNFKIIDILLAIQGIQRRLSYQGDQVYQVGQGDQVHQGDQVDQKRGPFLIHILKPIQFGSVLQVLY